MSILNGSADDLLEDLLLYSTAESVEVRLLHGNVK